MLNILEVGGISDITEIKILENNLNEVFFILNRFMCRVINSKIKILQKNSVVSLVGEQFKIRKIIW